MCVLQPHVGTEAVAAIVINNQSVPEKVSCPKASFTRSLGQGSPARSAFASSVCWRPPGQVLFVTAGLLVGKERPLGLWKLEAPFNQSLDTSPI